ncbi:unnamed protein product [Somion occarium]|uniref:Major facilitator superfamily (MFS) profile domain-containing protein n=1 Tax=Somion occarium TaxID=3059160 RepID=A0ABP1E555_9APHY
MDSKKSPTIFLNEVSHEQIELSSLETQRRQQDTQSNASITTEPSPSVNIQELPPVDKGWQAWSFCFAGVVLEALVWGFSFSYGIFQAYYTSHPPFDKASRIAVASVGPIALAIEYGEGFLLSFFYTRYPDWIKTSMWLGLLLSVLCLALSSFVNQVWLLILLQGVGLGVAGAVLYWPVVLYVSEWFVEHRGLAGGVIFAGGGLGGFFFPFIVNSLLDHVGHRWTLRALALLQGVLGGIALLGIRPRIPPPKYRPGQRRPSLMPRRLQFFKRKVFWTYSAAHFLQAMSYFPVSLYIAVFTESISSPLSATIVLSLFNSAGVVGQVLLGYLTDRFPYPWIMFASTLGTALSAFLLWGFADTLARVFAFAIIFGGLGGGFASIAFAAATDSANPNTEQAPIALTAFSVGKGIAAVVGPVLSGLLLEAGKSVSYGPYGKFGFGPVEIFVGSCALVCSFCSVGVAMSRPRV